MRRLAHEPLGRRPTTLEVTVRRYRCGHVWRQDTSRAAESRAMLSRRGCGVQHLTDARIAEGLGVPWTTANSAVPAEGRRVLIDDTQRFDGVAVIGVDERGSALGSRNLSNCIANSLRDRRLADPRFAVDCYEPLTRYDAVTAPQSQSQSQGEGAIADCCRMAACPLN